MNLLINKINEIYSVLSHYSYNNDRIGLLSGNSGIAISLLYAAKYMKIKRYSNIADIIIQDVSNSTANTKIFSHCSGISGIGWMYQFLNDKKFFNYDTNLILEDTDKYLTIIMNYFMQLGKIDFLHEALGIVYYFYQRYNENHNSIIVLDYFIKQLINISEEDSNGVIKWKTVINLKTEEKGYNISMSHGMSSIVVVLCKLYSITELQTKELKRIITGAMEYILMQEIDISIYGSFFPNIAIESTQEMYGSRLAWCYGDLGICMAIYQAGKTMNRQDWIDKALEVLSYSAKKRRNLQDNLVFDACLCHGTSGIALIFYRMWLNTKLPEFKEATDYWIEQTLKMAYFEDGLAGYKTWQGTGNNFVNETCLLEGIAGIGLVLLLYYYDIEPDWDECLLLS